MKTNNTMTDAAGKEVPVKYVPKYDRERDTAVRRVCAAWEAQRKRLEAVMGDTIDIMEKLTVAREKATGAKIADKGNVSFTSFDGNIKIEICQRYEIKADERVKEAQRLMIEWATGLVREEEGDTRRVLLALIQEAFCATASGSLPYAKIASLLRYEFKAEEWNRAVNLLRDSIQTNIGKRYVVVSRRKSREHDYERVKLDVADCWPEPKEE